MSHAGVAEPILIVQPFAKGNGLSTPTLAKSGTIEIPTRAEHCFCEFCRNYNPLALRALT
jgi:hypothetical protein